jgi:steroid 5-alpha reductase family enzyme
MMPILLTVLTLVCFMVFLFGVSLFIKNNGVADVGYGLAFLVVVGVTTFLVPPTSWYLSALIFMVFVWGIRLAVRIFLKNYGKPEDFRYRAWRESWGRTFIVRSFFQIYLLQGTIAFLIVSPVTLSLLFPASTPSSALFFIGMVVWLIGFCFELVGDYQLDRFLKNPSNKGMILMSGLWQYSRHPNYFGESTMWWGVALIGVGLSSLPWAVMFVSPILITFLLLKVSGVPMLEKRWEGNPAWEAYKEKTSVFLPLPPSTK